MATRRYYASTGTGAGGTLWQRWDRQLLIKINGQSDKIFPGAGFTYYAP
jgi:hypothetical protein